MSPLWSVVQALERVLSTKADVLFCRHTHVPYVRNLDAGSLQVRIKGEAAKEQCFIVHNLDPGGEATDLMAKYGGETVKLLWESISRQTVQRLRRLNFGFFELDCLLIHGTTVGLDEELKPETHSIIMCDRLSRMQANNLFCGVSY